MSSTEFFPIRSISVPFHVIVDPINRFLSGSSVFFIAIPGSPPLLFGSSASNWRLTVLGNRVLSLAHLTGFGSFFFFAEHYRVLAGFGSLRRDAGGVTSSKWRPTNVKAFGDTHRPKVEEKQQTKKRKGAREEDGDPQKKKKKYIWKETVKRN